jgi:hypothetical protein
MIYLRFVTSLLPRFGSSATATTTRSRTHMALYSGDPGSGRLLTMLGIASLRASQLCKPP